MTDLLDIGIYAKQARAFITAGEKAGGLCQPDDRAFDQLARELFTLQFNRNESYRRFCQARDATPKDIGDWTQIPALPAAAFKHYELTWLPAAERTTVFYSSGTTARRSRHFHNAATLELYEISLLAWFQACMPGLGNGVRGRFISLTPPPTQAPHSSLAHMLGKAITVYGDAASEWTGGVDLAGGWVVNMEATAKALAKASAEGCPAAILGTAFSFVHLLDYAAEHRLVWKLPAGSAVMETGGYKGRSRALAKGALHAEISRLLGVPRGQIICEYGMCELSSQAYDRCPPPNAAPAGGLSAEERVFHFPPWARARIISPETGAPAGNGETGMIQIFDLANLSSVLAVQTEDLGVATPDGFRLLGRAAEAETRGCSLMAV